MRWFVTILLCLSLGASAQQSYKVDVQNTSLKEVLEDLTQRYRLKISYDANRVQDHMITKRITTFSEADLLSELFSDLPFKIQLSRGIYLIIPKKIKETAKQDFVQGTITKDGSGEPLAFAHVQINDEGTVTNAQGRFTLPFPRDSSLLQVSYMGFKPLSKKLDPAQKSLNISMEQDTEILQEVVLTSEYYRDLPSRPSVSRLNPGAFSSLPSLGNVDIFKSIQLLPGVRATDETSSGLVVRGGTPEQNLVLLDGFTLYHLDHFFGIFSTFNPNTISNVEVYKGGFGAEYGGRISSVVDVTGKSGTGDKLSGGFGVNLISVDGYLETPLSKKSSLIAGFRRSFLKTGLFEDFLNSNRVDAVTSLDPEFESEFSLDPKLYFYDFTAKWRYQPTTNSVIDVNLYTSEDFYNGTFLFENDFSSFEVSDDAAWSNLGASVNWKNYFSPKWYSSIDLAISGYSNSSNYNNIEIFSEDIFNATDSLLLGAGTEVSYLQYEKYNEVSDASLKIHQEISIDDKSTIILGTEINILETNYALSFFEEDLTNYENAASLTSIYAQHRLSLGRFQSEIGFRYLSYPSTGGEFMEPRLSANYRLLPTLRIKGAWSKHHQFMNRLSLTPFGNSDQFYWVLADKDYYPILESRHAIFGIEVFKNNWTFDLEFYDKQSSGILESDYVSFDLGTTAGTLIESSDFVNGGVNSSQGMDFFAKYRTAKFTSWFSYSLSKSFNKFANLNRGNFYPSLQDQRHEVNLAGVYKLGNWEFSSVFIFGSGRAYTPPGDTSDESIVLYDSDRINSLRLPNYHRMDISAKYNFDLRKMKAQTGVTLFNIYNRSNIKSRRYAIRYDFDDAENTVDEGEDYLEVLPIDSKLLGFTPNFFFRVTF